MYVMIEKWKVVHSIQTHLPLHPHTTWIYQIYLFNYFVWWWIQYDMQYNQYTYCTVPGIYIYIYNKIILNSIYIYNKINILNRRIIKIKQLVVSIYLLMLYIYIYTYIRTNKIIPLLPSLSLSLSLSLSTLFNIYVWIKLIKN